MFKRLRGFLAALSLLAMLFGVGPAEHGSGAGGITPHGVVAKAQKNEHGPILWGHA